MLSALEDICVFDGIFDDVIIRSARKFIDDRKHGFQRLIFRFLLRPFREQFSGLIEKYNPAFIVAGNHPVANGDEGDFVHALFFLQRSFQ